jgi:GNAT superfamily N-acetyltransferase
MTTAATSTITDVTIRPLTEGDLFDADTIFRTAFNTFVGVDNLFGDTDYISTRWRADPSAAVGAEHEGRLVGSNFIADWGSIGFFGPLTVRPELWGMSIASQLMDATMQLFSDRGIAHTGLFTFPHSAKHLGIYQKFGYSPQHLTPVMGKPVGMPEPPPGWRTISAAGVDHDALVASCRSLTDELYSGLDLSREIAAVESQQLGDTVVLTDDRGVAAMAVCHAGSGTEAGGDACYVKFGAVRPGPDAADTFERLLDGCEAFAASQQAQVVILGVSTACCEAYASVVQRGFRAQLIGVTMQRPNVPGYHRAGSYVIDDWR